MVARGCSIFGGALSCLSHSQCQWPSRERPSHWRNSGIRHQLVPQCNDLIAQLVFCRQRPSTMKPKAWRLKTKPGRLIVCFGTRGGAPWPSTQYGSMLPILDFTLGEFYQNTGLHLHGLCSLQLRRPTWRRSGVFNAQRWPVANTPFAGDIVPFWIAHQKRKSVLINGSSSEPMTQCIDLAVNNARSSIPFANRRFGR